MHTAQWRVHSLCQDNLCPLKWYAEGQGFPLSMSLEP